MTFSPTIQNVFNPDYKQKDLTQGHINRLEINEARTIAEKISQVYTYVATFFAVTCATAFTAAKMGVAVSVISFIVGSPLLSGLVVTAITVAACVATRSISKENGMLKHGAFTLFAVWQGVFLSPLVLINSAAFVAAAGATVAIAGGLGALSMTLKESFEKYEKILMVALGALAFVSIGACFLPAAAARFAGELSLFGGLGLFGTFVIYNTHQARSKALDPEFDPLNHSIDIYMDVLNIFIRIFILLDRNSKK